MDRPTIHDIPGLEKYGLNCLTGEACAYSLRLLFDVNADGEQLLRDYFSADIHFAKNWNSKVNGKDATGSIMLPRELFKPLCLFIMFHVEQVDAVLIYGNCDFTGMAKDDKHLELYAQSSECQVIPNWAKNGSQPSSNGRNVHAFSGRTV